MTCSPRPSIRRTPSQQGVSPAFAAPRPPLPEHGSRAKRTMESACRACLSALRDGPKTSLEIVRVSEKSARTIYEALDVLEAEGRVERFVDRAREMWRATA
jgi:hypothetical protein